MSRRPFADALLLICARVVMGVERLTQPVCAGLMRVRRLRPIQRLHAGLRRLPPHRALPVFLVPEAASRLGWMASAWLLLNGAAWQALSVYVATKLLATVTALWIYRACEPALLRVGWFARVHAWLGRLRRRVLPRPSARWAAMRQRLRER